MNDTTRRRVELYVHSLAPCGTGNEQNAIVERLRDLERRDVIDDLELRVWGDAVCLDSPSAEVGDGARIADRIREFYDWCEEGRASLDPFFTWSVVDSKITGETFRRVVLPHRCLAVYADDGLEAVYPSSVGETVRSLQDGIDSLETAAGRPADHSLVFEEVG